MNWTTLDLAGASGLSPRQIDVLAAYGVFGPGARTGSGRARQFTDGDLFLGVVLARLADLAGRLSGGRAHLSRDLALDVADILGQRPDATGWLVVRSDGPAVVDVAPDTSAVIAVDLDVVRAALDAVLGAAA